MSKSSSSSTSSMPQRPYYQDTQYTSQARDLSNKGYQGISDNYQNVNVFSPETQQSLQDQANAVYSRAESDFARNYNDTMRNLATRNYNQFGTLNATAPSYVTDMQNLQQQRALMDSAYNKALYQEQLKDQELSRRYNTLNMYNQMYNLGQLPNSLDMTNQDIYYQNLYNDWLYNNSLSNSSGKSLF